MRRLSGHIPNTYKKSVIGKKVGSRHGATLSPFWSMRDTAHCECRFPRSQTHIALPTVDFIEFVLATDFMSERLVIVSTMKVKLKLLAGTRLYTCVNARLGLMKFSHVDLAVGASLDENDKL